MPRKKKFEPREVADREDVKKKVLDLASAVGIWKGSDDEGAREFRESSDADRAAKTNLLELLLPPFEGIFRATHVQDRTTGAHRPADDIVKALSMAVKDDEPRVREALKAIRWLRTRLRLLEDTCDPEIPWNTVLIELANIWFEEAKHRHERQPRPGPDQYGTLAESPFIEFCHLALADLYDGKAEPPEIRAESLAYRWRRLKDRQKIDGFSTFGVELDPDEEPPSQID